MRPTLGPWKNMLFNDIKNSLVSCFFSSSTFVSIFNSTKSNKASVFVRFTRPSWNRRGQVAAVIFSNKAGRTPVDWQREHLYTGIVAPTRSLKFPQKHITEKDLELCFLKTDIMASDVGYFIEDAFYMPSAKE